jgi:hypothetical protein
MATDDRLNRQQLAGLPLAPIRSRQLLYDTHSEFIALSAQVRDSPESQRAEVFIRHRNVSRYVALSTRVPHAEPRNQVWLTTPVFSGDGTVFAVAHEVEAAPTELLESSLSRTAHPATFIGLVRFALPDLTVSLWHEEDWEALELVEANPKRVVATIIRRGANGGRVCMLAALDWNERSCVDLGNFDNMYF